MRQKPTLVRSVVALLLGAMLLMLLPACASNRLHAYSATYLDETFDTVFTVTVGAKNADEADSHCRALKTIVNDLHRQFDAYHTYTGIHNIASVNAADTGTPVTVSEELMALLVLGREVYGQTDGAVHIGLGAVTALWKDAIATQILPSAERIDEALQTAPDLSGMVLDEEHMTVTLTQAGMQLDVGAIAKGYVLARLYAYAVHAGIESLLCNLGGEILAVGTAPNGAPWEVAIADPDGGLLQTVSVQNAVIATGGDYERGFVTDGQRYHHIVDPTTGYPAGEHRAATVVLPLESAAFSDAYSTALVILPTERGRTLAEDVPQMNYLLIHPNGDVETNDGWGTYEP